MRPSTALAATVKGEARYSLPGPLRPVKFRLMALTVTCSAFSDTPGPQPMHAPQPGWMTSTPARRKISR